MDRQAQRAKHNWMCLVSFLGRESLTPAAIFFAFKKKCEEIGEMLWSLDLNTAKKKSAVQAFTIQTCGGRNFCEVERINFQR
jgi:hypothetical protein